ncbi:unnamed protein product, partial [Polarella glacialis]
MAWFAACGGSGDLEERTTKQPQGAPHAAASKHSVGWLGLLRPFHRSRRHEGSAPRSALRTRTLLALPRSRRNGSRCRAGSPSPSPSPSPRRGNFRRLWRQRRRPERSSVVAGNAAPESDDGSDSASLPVDTPTQNSHRGARQRKQQQVRWQGDEALPAGPEDTAPSTPLLPSREIVRNDQRSRTIHTWFEAMLDDSEASPRHPLSAEALADVASFSGSPTGASPVKSVRSIRSARSLRTFYNLSLPTSPSSCRSSPGGHSPGGSAEGDRTSVLAMLRAYFLNSIDADGSARLSRDELFDHIRALTEESAGPLSDDLLELLGEDVRCRLAEIDLGLRSGSQAGLGMDEWIHFMLLRGSAPSHVAAKHLNRRLQKALADEPELLGRLHKAFEAADTEGDGLLRQDTWGDAFRDVGLSHPPTEVCLDREEDGSPWALGYYEFVGHALGMKASVVELALYDLSKGVARWVPPSLLGGHRFDGVWHSGLRVFGKEFWFGGAILESNFQEVPFGAPAKILRLGTTLRTHDELLEFLKEDVYVDYNPKSYDVLRRNCNHFANEL